MPRYVLTDKLSSGWICLENLSIEFCRHEFREFWQIPPGVHEVTLCTVTDSDNPDWTHEVQMLPSESCSAGEDRIVITDRDGDTQTRTLYSWIDDKIYSMIGDGSLFTWIEYDNS